MHSLRQFATPLPKRTDLLMNYDEIKLTTTVPSENQIPETDLIAFEGNRAGSPKIMFVGNSITVHEVKHEIGWHNKWGMAASAKEKDYVHLCFSHILQKYPKASFCICHAAEWERKYKDPESVFPLLENARRFAADVISVKLSGNTAIDDFDAVLFEESFGKLMEYLDGKNGAVIIVSSEFYKHPGETCIKSWAQKHAMPFVSLSDLGDMPEMKAIGLFEHEGVANHPGDLGMETIKNRICEVFDKLML